MKIRLIIILILAFMMSGCAGFTQIDQSRINAPENNASPIYGQWTVSEELQQENTSVNNVEFTKNQINIGDSKLDNPTYQLRKVNVDDYLFRRGIYHLRPRFSTLEKVEVITILDDDQFFAEAFMLSNTSSMLIIQDQTYILKKQPNQ
ncbi:hypothetical protein PRVXT_000439 [Proteinivorax tanatarense]|uniref:Lipoprotein n=1 Tax=Proteinivorax tanatarense TaxID=1260629 RepID=A0AAU7VN14_9FIRM